MGPGSRRALELLLLLLWSAPGARVLAGNTLGEPVTPHWVLDGQPWRPVTLGEPTLQLDMGLVVLEAGGQELLLELEKNRLLAPGYTETHYSPDGQPLVLAPNHTDHCHYHGHARGFPHSWVVLSACSEMRGLIRLNGSHSYYLRPWPPGRSQDFSTHRIFRMEQLHSWRGACGHPDPEDPGGMANLPPARQSREHREAPRSPRYLELYLVADHALFLTQHRNLNHTKQRLLEVANYVDQILRTLDIQVVLTGLEVWTEQDRSRVSADADATLRAFLRWRRALRRPHDSAQLLTGRSFDGATVGLAPVEGMCGAESSGGVSMDHAELPVGAAATVAHEIGHSLGLRHDPDGCCAEAAAEQGGCVMEAATGHPFPRVFSACSRRQLRAFFRKGGGACLADAPGPGLRLPPARCGNGFVEPGEDCDCGAGQGCPDPCCRARTCSLRAGAQCARGACCARCRLKPAGTPCRRATGDCDLPEFCTGASPLCPRDVYLLDGSPCAGGRGYCMDGECPTLEGQCQRLWGPGSRPAPDTCFQVVNSAGDARGNCGQDRGGRFLPCAPRDALCGKLQCLGGDPNPLDLAVPLEVSGVACPGASAFSEAQHGLPDLGLVEPGTRCGPRMVCQDRRCQNATFQELEGCLTTCHNRGVCNSNQNCHCHPGWAPPFCAEPGLGGSVDSGPVQPEGRDAFPLALLLSCLLPLLPGAGLAWCCRQGFHLQRCPLRCRRNPRSKDGSCRDHPLGGLPAMELGPTATGKSQALDPENSARAQQPP